MGETLKVPDNLTYEASAAGVSLAILGTEHAAAGYVFTDEQTASSLAEHTAWAVKSGTACFGLIAERDGGGVTGGGGGLEGNG